MSETNDPGATSGVAGATQQAGQFPPLSAVDSSSQAGGETIPSAPRRSRATTWEEIQPLVEMCAAGRLYDAQRWIDAGRPIDPPDAMKPTVRRQAPIAVAIETGFHSLVELLVRSGCRTHTRRGPALALALCHDRPDIAHLLLDLGAPVGDACFSEVLTHKWDRTLVDRFIALGADTITDNPLAAAFRHGMRPALGVYLAYKDRFPQWREQLGIALVHHIRKGSPRWVALLRWAGADPRLPVEASPIPGEYSYKQSPLEVAVSLGQVDLVRKFGIDPARDDMTEFLSAAAQSKKPEMIKHVLERTGQPLQGHPAGMEVIAEYCRSCSFSLQWPNLHGLHESAAAKGLCEMLAWGLPWQGADRTQTWSLRGLLYALAPYDVVQIARAMLKHKAASPKEVLALLGTDKMSAHLRGHFNEIAVLREQAERQEKRAQLYGQRRERSGRERMRKEKLKQEARERELAEGPDGRLVARVVKALTTRGPLPISRLARACRSPDVAYLRRVLIRMRAARKVECQGGGLAARWQLHGQSIRPSIPAGTNPFPQAPAPPSSGSGFPHRRHWASRWNRY